MESPARVNGSQVVAAIDSEHPDAVYCRGDLVGNGARPNETGALIRERGRRRTGVGKGDDQRPTANGQQPSYNVIRRIAW